MDHFISHLVLLLVSHLLIIQLPIEAKTSNGFTVDLIHRDSPLSPLYNKSATSSDLARNDALRSMARANHFLRTTTSSLEASKLETPLIPANAEYLMKISIGNPPIENLAVADTGSDLVWIQCSPCTQCYSQSIPLFDPSKSSTFQAVSCNSSPCQSLPTSHCSTPNNRCIYDYRYGDQSYTQGLLATDTFTFGAAASFQDSVFGCGVNQGGKLSGPGSGLVGLGAGPLSLVSQLGSQIDYKFSYCMVPRDANSASKLIFGSGSELTGAAVVSTPLSSGEISSYYYLTLEAVTVGDERIDNGQVAAGEGNIIIDSGTTLTLLETNLYNEIESAVQRIVGQETVPGPSGYNLCYGGSSFSMVGEFTMVFHYSGADVTLNKLNIFRDVGGDTVCFTMVPTSDGIPIYGNWAQMNFQVEYDLAQKQVSFAPKDCIHF